MSDELVMPKAVRVVWRDCTSWDAWAMPNEVAEIGCQDIETVGFLSWECEDFICVSVAWERMFGKVAGTFTIPCSQIIRIDEIELPSKSEAAAPKGETSE